MRRSRILKAQPGFTRQNKDYQEVMIYLNLADDYFKALQEAKMLKAQRDDLEKGDIQSEA